MAFGTIVRIEPIASGHRAEVEIQSDVMGPMTITVDVEGPTPLVHQQVWRKLQAFASELIHGFEYPSGLA